jgi:ketosteroid isomerase-like protein
MQVVKLISRLALAALVFASLAALAGEPDDEAALRRIKEELWPRAYATQDVDLLDSLLAPEFQLIDAEGNWSTKAEELDWVRHNAPTYDSLVFTILRLEIFAGDSAIVAGKGTITGTGNEGPYLLEYMSTNVLVRRDGRWQAVASHVSGITQLEP